MTKNEFLASFQNELQKRHIPDWEDVVSEYEQHFALKQADGFSEEEIAAKLGMKKNTVLSTLRRMRLRLRDRLEKEGLQ